MKLLKPFILIGLSVISLTSTFSQESNIVDSIDFKGSLRYRIERIDDTTPGSEIRNRHRYQAKLNAARKVNNYTEAEIEIASGDASPVSTNQSADDGFSTKGLYLNLANIKIERSFYTGHFGKAKNQFFKPNKQELIWDGDVNPEGIQNNFNFNSWKNGKIISNIGLLFVEENSSSKDQYLYAAQLMAQHKMSTCELTVGASLYNYDNLRSSSLVDPTGTSSYGNSSSIDTTKYDYGYRLIEGFIQYKFKFMNLPVSLAFDYVKNDSAPTENTGWLAGFKLGKAKKIGTWKFAYHYRNVEKDAVLGITSDSDFTRGGNSNTKGSEVSVGYKVLKNTGINLSQFISKTSTTNPANDYYKTQLDLKVTY